MMRRLLHSLPALWLQRTGNDVVSATTGVFAVRLVASAAGIVATFVVARHLQPQLFGHFMFLIMLMNLVENLIGPSLDASLVRFASSRTSAGPAESLPYFRLVFWIKLAAGVVALIVGLLAAPLIQSRFLTGAAGQQLPQLAVVAAFGGGAVLLLWRYSQSYFQVHQRFKEYGRIELITSVLRLVLVALLWGGGVGNLLVYLLAYIAAPGLVTLLTWRRLPAELLSPRHTRPGLLVEFFSYARWIVAAAVFTTLANRIDVFLLPWFATPESQRGCYFAALVLVNIGELAVLTLFHVLLPYASRLETAEERQWLLRKSFWPCVAVSAGVACLLPFSRLLVRVAFGVEYQPAGALFAILSIGVLFRLIAVPSVTLVMAAGRSGVIAMVEAAKFSALAVAGCVVLSTVSGAQAALGMAWTVATVNAATALLTFLVAQRIVGAKSTAPAQRFGVTPQGEG